MSLQILVELVKNIAAPLLNKMSDQNFRDAIEEATKRGDYLHAEKLKQAWERFKG